MKTGIKVGDIMTRNFISVAPTTDLRTCAKTMIKKRVGSLIVCEDEKLKGILTEKDIVWAVVKKSSKGLRNILVKDIMKRKVVTIKPSADLNEAITKFRKKKVRRLPVMEKGKLIGMITTKDVLRIEPGLFQMLAQTLQIKEETEKIRKNSRKGNTGICEECGTFDALYKDEAQSICEECFSRR